jgi:predicted ATP-binding protein involved in virulence
MELIYLYIDKYKNIKNQGFNFSPKYTCEFKDNNLIVTDNEKCNKNIFPDNINITAIVGKNGSGKSSVLEFLNDCKNTLDYGIIVIKDNKNIQIYTKLNITSSHKIVNEIDIKMTYINISHFFNPELFEKDNYIHLYKDISYPLDENESYNTFESNISKRFKNLKTELIYREIFNENPLHFLNNYFNIPIISFIQIQVNQEKDIYKKIGLEYFLYALLLDIDFYDDKYDTITMESDIKNSLYKLKRNEIKDIAAFIQATNQNSIDIENKNLLYKVLNNLLDKDNELLSYFELSFLDINKNEIILSSGEYIIYFYYMTLKYVSNSIVIFDELDLYLHPNLSRVIFKIIIENIKKNSNIILTTHSPFILSDIPKKNIIFLKDGKNVSDKVVIDTFGANIHTLLSHGFFMEDGLMGEFAKDKINEVIELLNQKSLTDKEIDFCEDIISIIGEPMIKNQLQKMLDSKRLRKVDKIDIMEKQIEALQNEIKDLKNG